MKRKQLENLKISLYKLRARTPDKDKELIDKMVNVIVYAQQLRYTLKEIAKIGAKHST